MLTKRPFLSIFILILVINFSYAFFYNIKPIVDAEAYDEIAANLVENSVYKSTIDAPIELDGSITRIGPGYELFLATNYKIFGRNYSVIWFLQAILYGLTIIMLGILSFKIFPELKNNKWAVYLSMIFLGVLIDIIQLNAMLMTESLFLFSLTLCFFYWSKISEDLKKQNLWKWLTLGLLIGALTLIRPTGLIIFVLVFAVSLFQHKKKALLAIGLLTFTFILIQLPWFLRNYRIYHQFVFHSTADGMNILSGNYPGNHGEFTADFSKYKELKEKYPSPIEFNHAAKAWFRDFVIHHPIQFSKVILEKISIFFSLAKTSGFWFHYHGKIDQIPTILISIFQNSIILGAILLFIIETLSKWRKHYRDNLMKKDFFKKDLLILCSLGILALTPIIAVIANRHRLPFTIMSLPILAYIFVYLKHNYRKMFWKILLVFCILGISTSIDVYLQFDKFKDRINGVGIENSVKIHKYYV